MSDAISRRTFALAAGLALGGAGTLSAAAPPVRRRGPVEAPFARLRGAEVPALLAQAADQVLRTPRLRSKRFAPGKDIGTLKSPRRRRKVN